MISQGFILIHYTQLADGLQINNLYINYDLLNSRFRKITSSVDYQ